MQVLLCLPAQLLHHPPLIHSCLPTYLPSPGTPSCLHKTTAGGGEVCVCVCVCAGGENSKVMISKFCLFTLQLRDQNFDIYHHYSNTFGELSFSLCLYIYLFIHLTDDLTPMTVSTKHPKPRIMILKANLCGKKWNDVGMKRKKPD